MATWRVTMDITATDERGCLFDLVDIVTTLPLGSTLNDRGYVFVRAGFVELADAEPELER